MTFSSRSYVAVTAMSSVTVTVMLLDDPEASPLQPVKVHPVAE